MPHTITITEETEIGATIERLKMTVDSKPDIKGIINLLDRMPRKKRCDAGKPRKKE